MGRVLFAFAFTGLLVYIARAFIIPIAMAGILAVLFFPMLERLETRKIPTRWGAAILTLTITLGVLIPLSTLVFAGAKAAMEQIRVVKEGADQLGSKGEWTDALVQSPAGQRILGWASDWFPIGRQDLMDTALSVARAAGLRLAELLGNFLASLPGMLVGLAVAIVSIYFLLADGRRLVLFLRRNTIFSPEQTEALLSALGGTCRSVILASVVSGLAQALTFMIACLATGVGNPVLVALLIFLGSFVPIVGSAPVTLTVSLNALLGGETTSGLILLAAAGVVGIIDNLIRPAFLKGTANLHPLLAFVAAFGGLQTMGFVGVFLGPVIAAVFVTSVEILLHGGNETPL